MWSEKRGRKHQMTRAAAIAACLSLALATSCLSLAGADCTTELRSVIQLDILDSATRAPAAAGATVLLGGPFSDSLVVSDTSTSPTAQIWYEDHIKRGTYSLRIQKPGYRDWSQTGIHVTADRCHTTTFDHIVALLRH